MTCSLGLTSVSWPVSLPFKLRLSAVFTSESMSGLLSMRLMAMGLLQTACNLVFIAFKFSHPAKGSI